LGARPRRSASIAFPEKPARTLRIRGELQSTSSVSATSRAAPIPIQRSVFEWAGNDRYAFLSHDGRGEGPDVQCSLNAARSDGSMRSGLAPPEMRCMRVSFRVSANFGLMRIFFVRREKHEVLCGVDARKSVSGRSSSEHNTVLDDPALAVSLRRDFQEPASLPLASWRYSHTRVTALISCATP
jgi:hypothetical protein